MRNMGSAGAMPSRALAGGGHTRVLDLRGGQCHCIFFFWPQFLVRVLRRLILILPTLFTS